MKQAINRRVSAVEMKGLHDSGGRPVSEGGTATTRVSHKLRCSDGRDSHHIHPERHFNGF